MADNSPDLWMTHIVRKQASSFVALATALIAAAFGAVSVAAETKPGKHLFILTGLSNIRQPLIGTFAETVEKVLGGDRVLVTSHSRPGQPILRWYRNWKPPEGGEKPEGGAKVYDELLPIVQTAIKGQKIESTTLVWMEGEEDAYFLKRLRDTKEGDGSMLDRTVVLWGSAHPHASHSTKNYPLHLAGGNKLGFKHGNLHDFSGSRKVPMANLFTSMLNAVDVPTEKFADSTGGMTELFG